MISASTTAPSPARKSASSKYRSPPPPPPRPPPPPPTSRSLGTRRRPVAVELAGGSPRLAVAGADQFARHKLVHRSELRNNESNVNADFPGERQRLFPAGVSVSSSRNEEQSSDERTVCLIDHHSITTWLTAYENGSLPAHARTVVCLPPDFLVRRMAMVRGGG